MTILILGVDPGEMRTGYAWHIRFDQQSQTCYKKGILQTEKQLFPWLDSWSEQIAVFPHDKFVVVCEDFIQRPGLEQKWIKQPTAKVFGAVAYTAYKHGATFLAGRPDNLRAGCVFAKIPFPKGHLSDDLSAQAHAAYVGHTGLPNPLPNWLGTKERKPGATTKRPPSRTANPRRRA